MSNGMHQNGQILNLAMVAQMIVRLYTNEAKYGCFMLQLRTMRLIASKHNKTALYQTWPLSSFTFWGLLSGNFSAFPSRNSDLAPDVTNDR